MVLGRCRLSLGRSAAATISLAEQGIADPDGYCFSL
jgi:hypothetical protein